MFDSIQTRKSVVMIICSIFILLLSSPVFAVNGELHKIYIKRTLSGSSADFYIFQQGYWFGEADDGHRTYCDENTSVTVTVSTSYDVGSAPFKFRLINMDSFDQTKTENNNYAFFIVPANQTESMYWVYIDDVNVGYFRIEFVSQQPPLPPTSFQAQVIDSDSVSLTWNDAPNETTYRLERNVNGGSYIYLSDRGLNSTSYTDNNCQSQTTYQYRIRSEAGSLYSSWVDSNPVTTPTPHFVSQPNTPSGSSSGDVNTSYSYSTGGSSCNQGHAVQYRFDWNADGGHDYSGWGSATQSHSWSVAGPYTVKAQARCAVDTNKESSWSNDLTVTVSAPPEPPQKAILPYPDKNETNVPLDTLLVWSDGGGATRYDVYLGTDDPPINRVGIDQTETFFCPDDMLCYNTTYFWRINAKNSAGTTPGDVWKFKTEPIHLTGHIVAIAEIGGELEPDEEISIYNARITLKKECQSTEAIVLADSNTDSDGNYDFVCTEQAHISDLRIELCAVNEFLRLDDPFNNVDLPRWSTDIPLSFALGGHSLAISGNDGKAFYIFSLLSMQDKNIADHTAKNTSLNWSGIRQALRATWSPRGTLSENPIKSVYREKRNRIDYKQTVYENNFEITHEFGHHVAWHAGIQVSTQEYKSDLAKWGYVEHLADFFGTLGLCGLDHEGFVQSLSWPLRVDLFDYEENSGSLYDDGKIEHIDLDRGERFDGCNAVMCDWLDNQEDDMGNGITDKAHVEFIKIWDVLTKEKPDTISKFWAGWKKYYGASDPEMTDNMRDVLIATGVPIADGPATVGAGGNITVNGADIVIPAGAVSVDREFVMAATTAQESDNKSSQEVELLIADSLGDINFSQPATLTIPYDDTGLTIEDELALSIHHYDESAGLWVSQSSSVDDVENKVSTEILHFSKYVVGLPGLGDPPAMPDGFTLINNIAATGSVNYVWNANTETDLAGYILNIISNEYPEGYEEALDPNATSYDMTGMKPGIYEVSLYAFDLDGNRGDSTGPLTIEILDDDGDLIADLWENNYFSDVVACDPDNDDDNDTLTNTVEYYFGTSPISSDTDNDLLPDEWEYKYGLKGNINDTHEDPDGDGFDNFQELKFNSNPRDPDSPHVVRVDIDNVGDLDEDGTAEHPFDKIQDGIEAAMESDVVLVKPGTYLENITFNGKNITLTSTNPEDSEVVAATVIDGGGNGSVVTFSGLEGPGCSLAGFTITNGLATNGGGICGNNTAATIINCVITENTAIENGGGIHACGGMVQECIIDGNTAGNNGGGVYFDLRPEPESWSVPETCRGVAIDKVRDRIFTAGSETIRVYSRSGQSLLDSWGEAGGGDGQFDSIHDLAVDSAGNVYVADHGNQRIQKLTAEGNFLGKRGTQGSGDGQFENPHDITVDQDGFVYVADEMNNRIQVFGSSDDLPYLRQWGAGGNDQGQFSYPRDIAINSQGYIYVADSGNNRVQIFTYQGENYVYEGELNEADDQSFDTPYGLAIDNQDNIYISDYNNKRILKFSPSKEHTATWDVPGRPQNIDVDSSGYIYVPYDNRSSIDILNPNGGITPALSNCQIRDNSAAMSGGGISGKGIYGSFIGVNIQNSVIYRNTSPDGAGIAEFDGEITNCTIAHNNASQGGGILNCSGPITNSIIWGNTAPTNPQIDGQVTISYSCIEGGCAGTEILDEDPIFLDPAADDYHLSGRSPCVDAGDPDADYSNEPWPNGDRINLGAYGNTSEAASRLNLTIYVDGNTSDPDEDGSEEHPFDMIREGINAALDGDVVMVARGIYNDNITLNKNITVTCEDPNDPTAISETIIDGQKAGSTVSFEGDEDSTCVLTGFTITGGANENGGGINGAGTGATIKRCQIMDNNASEKGGGIFDVAGLIQNCVISGNRAWQGGGLYTSQGTSEIINNTIVGNFACGGGGIYIADNLPLRIENNIIVSNLGGGVAADEQFSSISYAIKVLYWDFEDGNAQGWIGDIWVEDPFVPHDGLALSVYVCPDMGMYMFYDLSYTELNPAGTYRISFDYFPYWPADASLLIDLGVEYLRTEETLSDGWIRVSLDCISAPEYLFFQTETDSYIGFDNISLNVIYDSGYNNVWDNKSMDSPVELEIENAGFELGDTSYWIASHEERGSVSIVSPGLNDSSYHAVLFARNDYYDFQDPNPDDPPEVCWAKLSRTIECPFAESILRFDYNCNYYDPYHDSIYAVFSVNGHPDERLHVGGNGKSFSTTVYANEPLSIEFRVDAHAFPPEWSCYVELHIDNLTIERQPSQGSELNSDFSYQPLFVQEGYFDDNGTADNTSDDIWIPGDYHLLPSSSCIDAGDPASDWSLEPWPNGGRINMGAYGGTPEATRSRDGLVAVGFEIVNKTRVGRTIYEYDLALNVENQNSYNVTNVEAKLVDATEAVTSVSDDSATFALIPAGQTVASDDTFSITVNRANLIEPGRLTWELIYYAMESQGTSSPVLQNFSLDDLGGTEVIGDVSGDDKVDIVDLAQLAACWLQECPSVELASPPDKVDLADFAEIANNWLIGTE